MLTSATWWMIIVGGLCLGFGFAAGQALFWGIVNLFRK